MSKHRSDRFSNETVLASVRHAAQACIAAGLFPSKHNLRRYGVRGSPERTLWAREQLIASGELVISDAMQQHAERRPIATQPKRIQAMQECIPKQPTVKPHRPPRYDSPVWGEVVAGERAWKHVMPWWKRAWRRAKGEQHVPRDQP